MSAPALARVAVPVLVQVVTAADHRCECTGRGCHGRVERCERTAPAHRLTAAPRDPQVPADAAWRVPVGQLGAWCDRCHDQALADARRARQQALRAELLGDLFRLDPTPSDDVPSDGTAIDDMEVTR